MAEREVRNEADSLAKFEAISTLWNLLGSPIFLSSGEMVNTRPENIQLPIGDERTDFGMPRYTLGVERGEGLYGQGERSHYLFGPDLLHPPDKDFRFTFSRYF